MVGEVGLSVVIDEEFIIFLVDVVLSFFHVEVVALEGILHVDELCVLEKLGEDLGVAFLFRVIDELVVLIHVIKIIWLN